MRHLRASIPSRSDSPISDYAYDTQDLGLGIPSQGHSPTDDYTYDGHTEAAAQAARQPLRESTGNVQPYTIAAQALCLNEVELSPPMQAIPTPPFAPSQPFISAYGTPSRCGRSMLQDVSLCESRTGHPRGCRNPIYSWKHFADYRAKVMQKETENEDPTWPLYLEDAFLDALLLIPLMGRKKFSFKGVLYGRNMLISEYLWICHWLLYPPALGEILPTGKAREKHKMFRQRKQVSSHIQVLKHFFESHPLFHFFFPRRNDEKDEERRSMKEDDRETDSLKNNRVLIALAEGRLPDERPNYDYFARLLGGDSEVFVRPKTCWVYVSSSEISLAEDSRKAYAPDGSCLDADAFAPDGTRLECKGDYPHLILNNNKDTRRDLGHGKDGTPKYLLHEYTRTLSQRESSTIRDVAAKWDNRFPELYEKLQEALDDTHPSHERTSRCVVGPCDTIHFEVVLDLHATSRFPAGSHLDGVVHLAICRPELANHSWRSVTTVIKPSELESEDSEEDEFWNFQKECELSGRSNTRDTIEVPFPATSWARTFINLAAYVTAERENTGRDRARKTSNAARFDHESAAIKGEDGEEATHKPSGKIPTAMELLQQVAMYQEIWSSPNDGSENPGWTRRAVIFWTFVNVHSTVDSKGKVQVVPAGTNWRFLSKIDPTSAYHQERAYLSASPSVPRGVMSPDPEYQLHLNTVMHENFGTAYDAQSITVPSQKHSHISGLALSGGCSNGLVTPPHTASLHPGYDHNFDGNTISSNDSLHLNLSFLSDTSGPDGQNTLIVDPTVASSFLTGLDGALGAYEETGCDPNLQAWAAHNGLQDLDQSQWSTTYVDGQQSLAWVDCPTTASTTTTTTSGDTAETQWHTSAVDPVVTTPWVEGKDPLWAASMAVPSTTKAHSQALSQSLGQLAGPEGGIWDTTSTAASQPWLEAIASGSNAWDDLGMHCPEDSGSGNGTCLSAVTTSTLMPLNRCKRARADSAEDHEGYPCHSIRKLTHVPAAGMEDGEVFFGV